MPEQPKPVLWLELDESADGLPSPPKMWWALCSSRIHYQQPASLGTNPLFPLYAIPADQVLVPRGLLERICTDRSLMPGHNAAINAIDELRALLQR